MEQTELKERRYVGVRETLIYGVANGGQVIGYNLVRMQLTFFLVTVFGIPGQAVSLMIFFMGIWDTMNDPIMGTIVDKTRTRYGKLRPYLLFVPIPLGAATILFFGGAEFLRGVESTTAKIVYMCITYFIWEFFYTIGDSLLGNVGSHLAEPQGSQPGHYLGPPDLRCHRRPGGSGYLHLH